MWTQLRLQDTNIRQKIRFGYAPYPKVAKMPHLDGQLTRKRAAVTQFFVAKFFCLDMIFPNM